MKIRPCIRGKTPKWVCRNKLGKWWIKLGNRSRWLIDRRISLHRRVRNKLKSLYSRLVACWVRILLRPQWRVRMYRLHLYKRQLRQRKTLKNKNGMSCLRMWSKASINTWKWHQSSLIVISVETRLPIILRAKDPQIRQQTGRESSKPYWSSTTPKINLLTTCKENRI